MKIKSYVISFVLCIVAATVNLSCIGQCRLFKEIAKLPEVESVYLGKEMLKMAGKSISGSSVKIPGINSMISSIEAVEVINCENGSTIEKIMPMLEDIIKKLELKVFVEANDEGEQTLIYGRVPDDGPEGCISDMIVVNIEDNECNLVYINGKVDIAGMKMN